MALALDSIGKKLGPVSRDYTWKDVVLYALGVGAGFDELDYCYESRLKVIPSFAIGAVFDFLAEVGIASNANLAGILHGEQDLIFHHSIPTDGKLITEGSITHMYDKGVGKGALVRAEADTYHSNGSKLFTHVCTLFCRLDGGFGGSDAPKEPLAFPERPPDHEERALPSLDQPLLYRLSGDIFALHVDPEFARASGFERPIMHGLCTHGFACRAVIKHLFPGEPERMTRFRNRFSRPIYPGIPIKTQIWKLEEGKALFKTINEDTGEIVIDRGMVEWMSRDQRERRSHNGGIRFDGQVAVVTGAGAGLGRMYALELAKRGAKIVVNDLGASRDGSGESSMTPADRVVEEIQALGSQAVPSYDSVASQEGGEAIIKRALDAFGRVDILINNAGILRDKTLAKMGSQEWDAIMEVHLDGAYHVTRPAFLKMREQGYGRIIVTTSAAGLYGNFGQTNYAAAKMALVGFMNSLKLEGAKHNIKINAIAPIAATRLTEDILPNDLQAKLKPEFVAPLVVYLCSEQCPVSGGVYNAGMGYYGSAAIITGPGAVLGKGTQAPTPEDVASNIKQITALDKGMEFPDLTQAFAAMLEALNPQATPDKERGFTGYFWKAIPIPRKDQAREPREVMRFDHRVALVTGAGAGLGRIYALELARKGAKVVVNDLGGARDGSGGSASPADRVVAEILAAGGEAVASYDSVATAEGGEAIIGKAIETFGRVDILINNAGILRDKTLAKMEPQEWEAIMAVHLDGAFNVTRPAFLKMREQGYGRVIVTTSAAGLYGNFGQTNYAAAKMGLVGFMNTLKLEGEKRTIKVNAIAPIAMTRLTADILPPDLQDKSRPEFVAPMVLYLCSEHCAETGMIFNAGMGCYNRAAVLTGPGKVVGDGCVPPTPEEIHQAWDAIHNMKEAKECANATALLSDMLASFSPADEEAARSGGTKHGHRDQG